MVVKIPGTVWKPLSTNQTQPMMRGHDIICLHTMVGYLTSTYAYFKRNGYGGTESHFGIGGKWGPDADAGLDGVVWQFQDLDYTADANLDGNWHVLSIETADNVPKTDADIPEWTPKQVDAIVDLVAKLCAKYNIPPVLIPDTRIGRRGIGYHRQGVDPWRVSAGERWSSVRGKPCPGSARIRQIEQVIVPRVQARLNGTEEQDMQPNDIWGAVHELTAAEARNVNYGRPSNDPLSEGDVVSFKYLMMWGAAGTARNFHLLNQTIGILGQQGVLMAQMMERLQAMESGETPDPASAEAVNAAFAQGISDLRDSLDNLRLSLTVQPDETEPPVSQ